MRKTIFAVGIMAILIVSATGCWSKYELTELGFVMGAAIDYSEDGKFLLTTEIYKPQKGGAEGEAGTAPSYINLTTSSYSILQAIRGIPAELGRKSQWSHMRVILISEQAARKINIGEILDFFYRDHEPRLTVSILITDGPAKPYLETEQIIEQTASQLIIRSEEAYARFAARTFDSTLLEIGKQLKREVRNTVIAYLEPDPDRKKRFRTDGSVLIREGKMVDKLSAERTKAYLMLRNEFAYGIINVPCMPNESDRNLVESFEIIRLRSNLKPRIIDNRLHVSVKVEILGAASELKCSKIMTYTDERKFLSKAEEVVRQNISDTVEFLQERKVDVLQLGNQLYGKNPRKWTQYKKEWGEYFGEAEFDISVKMKMDTSGTLVGKPVLQR